MSQKEIMKANNFFTCENSLQISNSEIIAEFLTIASKLRVNFLVIDDLSISKRTNYLESSDLNKFFLTSSQLIYEGLKDKNISHESLKEKYKSYLYSDNVSKILLSSRKTIRENSIDKIKKQLGSIRNQYEIISLYSNDKNTLKWAAQDRRLDYITIEILENSNSIDQSLCSVIKQNNKNLEVVLSPIIKARTDRDISEVLRKGKKVMQLVNATNTPFIYTMKPESPLELRTGSQMRLLGSLLGIPYNQTKNCVFEKQMEILVNNTLKLHESHVVEGVREVRKW